MDHSQEIAEIWALFRENREQLMLLREQSQETDRRFQETERLLKEESLKTERQFQETERLLKEESLKTDRRFQETERLLKEASQKTDEQMRRTDQRINQLYGTFSHQWGRLIEALVKPDAVRLFRDRGIDIIGANPRMERHRNGETMELDLVLLNSKELVVMEVKSIFTQAEVVEFLADLQKFQQFFPEYRGYRVYGAIAGLEIPSDVGRYAYRQGLFVVVVSGQGLVAMRNDTKFKPKNFGATV